VCASTPSTGHCRLCNQEPHTAAIGTTTSTLPDVELVTPVSHRSRLRTRVDDTMAVTADVASSEVSAVMVQCHLCYPAAIGPVPPSWHLSCGLGLK
jgi:hypothetical protein